MAANNILHFKNYHTITFYVKDYSGSQMKIFPLTSFGFTEQESVKVKILDNKGLDLTRSDDEFITDVSLPPDLRQFCANISPTRYRDTEVVQGRFYKKDPFHHVDYSLECYWALTSRLRGYHITFRDNHLFDSHPFSVRPINRPKLKALLAWCEILEDEDEDEEEYSGDTSDDSAVDGLLVEESEINSPLRYSSSSDSLLSSHSDVTVSDHFFINRRQPDPLVTALRELSSWASVLLVIEYNEGRDFVSRHNIRQVGKNAVIELLDSDGACSCTVITAGQIHASAWDLELHSDEGAYESGINVYTRAGMHRGIVLMGEQNGNTHNYAISLYNNIIVPDLAE